MIPEFPNFKKLELADKVDIESHYRGNVIPSDYHFASLWAWDLNNDLEVSVLNNNLVVKFQDYTTEKRFYSFFGNNHIKTTLITLFEYLKENNIENKISMIPEQNLEGEDLVDLSKSFEIDEDESNFDYIFSVKELLNYKGKKLYSKKKQLNKFMETYYSKTNIVIYETIDPDVEKDLLQLLEKWSDSKSTKNEIEISALKRTLSIIPQVEFLVFCIYIENRLVGFSLLEIIDHNHAIHSFQKADITYVGITEFINNKVAEFLDKKGIAYINAEQDLGIEGLRRAKRSYNPSFLKKYTISKK